MFYYMLKKEFLLIFRDIHALLVLFVMPLLFIVIMSLALKNSFDGAFDSKYKVAFINVENKQSYLQLIKSMQSNEMFEFTIKNDQKHLLLYDQEYDFVVDLPNDFKKMIQNDSQNFEMTIFTKAEISQQYLQALKSLLGSHITKIMMQDLLASLGVQNTTANLQESVKFKYLQPDGSKQSKPTSVQYSVPAWLVFSIFFIVIPISNTFINEKKDATLDRIKTTGVSMWPVIGAKFIPYFLINQTQILVMLGAGFFLIPLLGGDKLVIQSSLFGVFFVSFFISFAAISFAILIANFAKSTEEATTIGGVSNIILAALGGIMVPKFVMPLFMQNVAQFSPMSWALESLFEFILKSGNVMHILDYLIYLLLFGIICLSFAYILLKKGA